MAGTCEKVLIIEEDRELHAPLARLLVRASLEPTVVSSGVEALQHIAQDHPHAAIVDLGLPDMDGVKLVQTLHAGYPDIALLVLTVTAAEGRILAAIRAGACGCLLKEDAPECLVPAIREALRGGAPMSPAVARVVLAQIRAGRPAVPSDTAPPLTDRELEVVEQLARGVTYEEAAEALHVSVNTIRTHIRNIYEKLAVASRTEAVLRAMRLGLIRPHGFA
jgi:DNA-binding NarL/FixJ family response regulator